MVSLRPKPRPGSRGFTLIEILVSVVVLSLAVMGLLSLLVTSTKVSGEVVENTFSATLARSVYDSLRVAARERSFAVNNGSDVVRGLVFVHDGVKNRDGSAGAGPPALPTSPDDTAALAVLRKSDFVLFFPPAPAAGVADPIFVFPRPGGAEADNAANKDNTLATPVENANGLTVAMHVGEVYSLRDDMLTGGALPTDLSAQYGFAIQVSRARSPDLAAADGTVPNWSAQAFTPRDTSRRDGLYLVTVMIFRNFNDDPEQVGHTPIYEFAGLLTVGP